MKTELEHITIDSVSKAGPVERLQDDVALVYDISRIRLPEAQTHGLPAFRLLRQGTSRIYD